MDPTLPTLVLEPGLPGLVSIGLTAFLPLLVAFLTKQSWSATVKTYVLLALAAVASFGEAYLFAAQNDQAFDVQGAITLSFLRFVLAAGTYFAAYKGSGAAAFVQANTGLKDKPGTVLKADGGPDYAAGASERRDY